MNLGGVVDTRLAHISGGTYTRLDLMVTPLLTCHGIRFVISSFPGHEDVCMNSARLDDDPVLSFQLFEVVGLAEGDILGDSVGPVEGDFVGCFVAFTRAGRLVGLFDAFVSASRLVGLLVGS